MSAGSPPPDTAPLDEAELAAAFSCLDEAGPVLAAVSGGPDSMALMGALALWHESQGGPPVQVATVDHGLRPGSRDEAEAVAAFAGVLGLPHAILPWPGKKSARVSQEEARRARYGLLEARARELGATHLVTAHTLDDQAETLMIRLAAGSGLSGLACMRPEVARDALLHVRPFLRIPKARLVSTCRARGWAYVEDPSNADPRFGRVRWRGLMPVLAAEGLDAERLGRLAGRLARADEALDRAAAATFDLVARRSGEEMVLDMAALAREPAEIALRVLKLALRRDPCTGGAADHLRLERLEDCLEALLEAAGDGCPIRRTLAGRMLQLDRAGVLTVASEGPRRRGRGER